MDQRWDFRSGMLISGNLGVVVSLEFWFGGEGKDLLILDEINLMDDLVEHETRG